VVIRLIVAVLARMLPAGFRDRQRAEWLGDLGELPGPARLRYLVTATLTLPSLYVAARRRTPWTDGIRTGSGGYGLVAVFAVVTAMFGAAVAGRLTYTPPGPMLSAAASQALAATVFPGRVVDGSPKAPAFTTDADDETLPGGALFEVPSVPTSRDLRADAITARDRLAAAGWTIDDDVHYDLDPATVDVNLATDTSWAFTAHTADLTLEFGAWRYGTNTTSYYGLGRTTYPRPPATVLLAAAAVAFLAGWLAACRLSRRVAGLRNRAAMRAAIPTIVALAVAPAAFLLVNRLVAPIPDESSPPRWYLLFVEGGDNAYFYAATVAVLALGLALRPTIREPIRAIPWEYAERP
jgi:hypothetical protein